jgi:hypothetical protein
MVHSDRRPRPAEPHGEIDAHADGGAQAPMSQQDDGFHGHEMHPQKFVRLIGCHDPEAAKHQAADRLQ